ncbi:hypothetical protein [Streptomyces sp. ITFR-6]|uniref:hypothetical protein n=1 Tax=Streptomyces sp. ITFR-6 TaxID=3075197 RepID=UPI00288A392F|nr:hypothetical protein [Streptomyces sp. ITFR-6]WNI30914.1 hypothetical protein RLT59_20625 [Streptomyces sp. ITFR-6]
MLLIVLFPFGVKTASPPFPTAVLFLLVHRMISTQGGAVCATSQGRGVVVMAIMDQFVLRRDGLVPKGVAATCSGERYGGTAAVWKVKLEGRPDLAVHDTRWENGERDLVLYQPAVVPEMPAPLANRLLPAQPGRADAEAHRVAAEAGPADARTVVRSAVRRRP